jgi:hypothetical protein
MLARVTEFNRQHPAVDPDDFEKLQRPLLKMNADCTKIELTQQLILNNNNNAIPQITRAIEETKVIDDVPLIEI